MRQRPTLGTLLFGGTFFLFGLVFLLTGGYLYGEVTPDSGDLVVPGVVVDMEESSGSEGGTVYAPMVEYEDPSTNKTYQAVGSIRSSSQPRIGDAREVAYPPGRPDQGKVVGQSWLAWIFIGVGAAVLLALFTATVSSIRRVWTNSSEVPHFADVQDAIYRGPQDAPQPQPSHTKTRKPGFGGPKTF